MSKTTTAKPKIMPTATADDLAKYGTTATIQTIPATTDARCADLGATCWGCSCSDFLNRGGSYLDAAGSRLCKHMHHQRQASKQAQQPAPVAQPAEAIDTTRDARIQPVPALPAEPAPVADGIDAECVTYKATAKDCNCADRSFALLADDNTPCRHMQHVRALAAPAPVAAPAPAAEPVAPAADIPGNTPEIKTAMLACYMMATGKFGRLENAVNQALFCARQAAAKGMTLMGYLEWQPGLKAAYVPADHTHLPTIAADEFTCSCSPNATANNKCSHLRARRAGIKDGTYIMASDYQQAKRIIQAAEKAEAEVAELAAEIVRDVDEDSAIDAAELMPYARREVARRQALARQPLPEWAGLPEVSVIAHDVQAPFLDDFTPDAGLPGPDWRYYADPQDPADFWLPDDDDVLGLPLAS